MIFAVVHAYNDSKTEFLPSTSWTFQYESLGKIALRREGVL